MIRVAAILMLYLFAASPVIARDLYVAPIGAPTHVDPDGSDARPYPSLADAFRMTTVNGGDRLLMREGSYGPLVLGGLDYDRPVIFQPVPGEIARVDYIAVKNSRNLTIRDLHVIPDQPTGQRVLVQTDSVSSDISFEGLHVQSRPDLEYRAWRFADWTGPMAVGGVRLNGPRNRLLDSRIIGMTTGITSTGVGAQVIGNYLSGFSADGLRGLGDETTFVGNRIEDCIKIDGNHDDGFQAWAPRGDQAGATLSGLVLEQNSFIEWTGPPNHPLRCVLQGIGMFDGPYQDIRIRNNLVAVSAYHGITVSGAQGLEIVGNTVVLIDAGISAGHPWIMIGNGKEGTPARNVTLVNNVAMRFSDRSGAITTPIAAENATVVDLVSAFADPLQLDYRPRRGGPLIDAARTLPGWDQDINAGARPLGPAPDLGAYEVQ
ncbi:right-handed parallel beta-helix repeat-containing protein [Loktanella agnita]|uniref:right-handed parallel beta-helix repeat-containing protein n=1 Tax=Loktanella agnita TaxID=287097 RepID=UPI003987EB9D